MIPTGWDVSTLGLGDDAAAAGEVDVPADALATEVGAAEAPGELTAGVDEQAPITTVVTTPTVIGAEKGIGGPGWGTPEAGFGIW